MTETDSVFEWRIENLSHWCPEVHGESIQSPQFNSYQSMFTSYDWIMKLYPNGVSGQDKHLVVHIIGFKYSFSGELSFYSSDGTLLCKQPMNGNEGVVELPPGPAFADVLSRNRKIGDDFITLRLRNKTHPYRHERMRTTIEVLKTSVKIDPRWIIPSNGTIDLYYIMLSTRVRDSRISLCAHSKNNAVQFLIKPPSKFEYPFAVEICLTASDGNVHSYVRKGHVFHDYTPWTFSDPIEKEELVGKEISMDLCIKARKPIPIICCGTQYTDVEIEPETTPFFLYNKPFTNPKKHLILTKDSKSQTSEVAGDNIPSLLEKEVTDQMENSNKPEESVTSLIQDLMCLFQDQDFSDITLKCDKVSFPVHKNVLSARSPVFKTMLSTDMTEAASSEVVVDDLDPSTLSLFLAYLYTGAVEEDLECDRVLKLYYAADKYQVPSLKSECVKYLCGSVSVSTVCDILSLGNRHSDDKLISAAHEFILINFNEVLKSSDWKSFMCREPLLAVKTVTNYAEKDSVGRMQQVVLV